MEEHSKHGNIGVASLRSGMHRDTGAKYIKNRKLPSELERPRTWRTRQDVFADDWHVVRSMLQAAPELEAKALFDWLTQSKFPGKYQEGQLRTFQRSVKR